MGKKSAAIMTPEERKERARKGANGKWHKNDINDDNSKNAN